MSMMADVISLNYALTSINLFINSIVKVKHFLTIN